MTDASEYWFARSSRAMTCVILRHFFLIPPTCGEDGWHTFRGGLIASALIVGSTYAVLRING
jgi:hypothetical protein